MAQSSYDNRGRIDRATGLRAVVSKQIRLTGVVA